jgi:hypothetical protein
MWVSLVIVTEVVAVNAPCVFVTNMKIESLILLGFFIGINGTVTLVFVTKMEPYCDVLAT